MSRRTTYTCDRCKKPVQPGIDVHTFEFGKGQTFRVGQPNINAPAVPGIIMDLCGPCWTTLLRFLGLQAIQRKPIPYKLPRRAQ